MNSMNTVVFFAVIAAASAANYGLTLEPSYRIARSEYGLSTAPLVVTRAAPIALGHAAPLAIARSSLSLLAPRGSGLEGQWFPDINEKLYDDGTYKPYRFGL